jgi:hypothetical protein
MVFFVFLRNLLLSNKFLSPVPLLPTHLCPIDILRRNSRCRSLMAAGWIIGKCVHRAHTVQTGYADRSVYGNFLRPWHNLAV